MCPSLFFPLPPCPPLCLTLLIICVTSMLLILLLCQYHLDQVVLWPEDDLKQSGVSYDDEE